LSLGHPLDLQTYWKPENRYVLKHSVLSDYPLLSLCIVLSGGILALFVISVKAVGREEDAMCAGVEGE
jgi:hypothetical protein